MPVLYKTAKTDAKIQAELLTAPLVRARSVDITLVSTLTIQYIQHDVTRARVGCI